MYQGKHSKKTKISKLWFLLIALIVVTVLVMIFVRLQPETSQQAETVSSTSETAPAVTEPASTVREPVPTTSETVPEETNVSQERNTFFLDLSCSGTITNIDDNLCFVADQMYSIEIEGTVFEDVNIFYLNDIGYQAWAEQPVIIRASSLSRSEDHMLLELQYLISDDVCVSTPFSEYHFPAQWADRLLVTHSYSDSCYKVDFFADMEEAQEHLFSIVMGEADATPIGKLTDSMDGVTMVYLIQRTDDFSSYSQTDQDYLHSMMEGVNYLLDRLNENPQFSNEF